MLHDVRDEGPLAIDPRIDEGAIENAAGGSHERLAIEVLAIARLLPDEHQRGRHGSGPEDGLGGPSPQVAGAAAFGGLPDGVDRCPAGRRVERGHGTLLEWRGQELGVGRGGHAVRSRLPAQWSWRPRSACGPDGADAIIDGAGSPSQSSRRQQMIGAMAPRYA